MKRVLLWSLLGALTKYADWIHRTHAHTHSYSILHKIIILGGRVTVTAFAAS